ncbi:MAG: hypothetical protein J2O49_08030, partial [Sciscionella sp.]|nr:hypothetical protein [Sciscionella sp.]
MANIDIEKPYFQQLASELAIPDAKQSDPYPGNVTSDDLHKLLIWVANWADLCTAPRNMEVLHPGEWGYASIDNRYGGDGMSGDYENRPYDLPIPGLTIDHFFGDALALTGQEMAELGEVYQIVVGDYVNFNRNLNNAPDDQTNVPIDQRIHQDTEPEFQRGLEVLFQTWTGPAREACQLYASHLIGYLETEKSIVGDFAQCLTAYGSIIRTARRNVVQHMQTFVNQMSAKAANDEAQTEHENQFAIAACSAVVAGLISGGFGAAGA